MRYERQILMSEVGLAGQKKLKEARVLVVGAGGLGCPVLTYLTCAGIGNLRIVDQDIISESNLNRQFLYGSNQIGQKKVDVIKERLHMQNPDIQIETYSERLTVENVEAILNNIQVVVDCVDNIETRLLLNKYCILKNIPLIEAGIQGFYGFVTFITKKSACLKCIGVAENTKSYAPIPVIGVTAGVVGALQANECIQYILGVNETLEGYLLQYDGKEQKIEKIKVDRDPKCSVHIINN